MLIGMGFPEGDRTLLLLDTCVERGSLALARGSRIEFHQVLAERVASAALLGSIREGLRTLGMSAAELDGVGVVNGPGSFTGVRVSLALAKGLCEATGVPLAAVSRLAVLAEAGGITEGLAVLWAGREQVYVRECKPGQRIVERLVSARDLARMYGECEAAFAEEAVVPWLKKGLRPRRVELTAALSLGLAQRCLADGGSNLAQVDANYVRNEEAIYASGIRQGEGNLC